MAQYRNNTARRRTNQYKKPQSGNELVTLFLFYILPFIIFNAILFFIVTSRPKITVELADTHDYLTTETTLTIKSWYPRKSISLSMDNEELEMTKGKGRTYTATITKNGVIEATVTNLNGMTTTVFEQVNILDDNPPSIDEGDIIDGIVTMTVSDSQSGINFDSIYALNSRQEQVEPINIDKTTATISYMMDSAGLSVFVQDKAGNEVRGNFTSHKEGDVDILEGDTEVTIE